MNRSCTMEQAVLDRLVGLVQRNSRLSRKLMDAGTECRRLRGVHGGDQGQEATCQPEADALHQPREDRDAAQKEARSLRADLNAVYAKLNVVGGRKDIDSVPRAFVVVDRLVADLAS